MSSRKSKLHLIGAFAALATLALGVSCTGFFQNPTLTTITIDPPTPSVGQGATQQLTATGTFQDGTTAALTGGTSCSGNTVCWSSSDTTIATISTGGNVTGITTTATVVLNNITNFQICEGTFGATSSCSSGSTPLTWNATLNEAQPFIAQGSSNGQLVDLTASSTWTVPSTATDVTCINSGTSPETCEVTTGATNTSVVVTYGTTTTTLSATLNVVVQ
jgi:Bacterial Ig-like domain (group 2)